MFAKRCSVSVSDCDANAMDLPIWIKAAPKPLDNVSTCIMDVLDEL